MSYTLKLRGPRLTEWGAQVEPLLRKHWYHDAYTTWTHADILELNRLFDELVECDPNGGLQVLYLVLASSLWKVNYYPKHGYLRVNGYLKQEGLIVA